nr:DNA mismatch repair protein MLH3 isoform X1 [Tanacetum cinerariifolium]
DWDSVFAFIKETISCFWSEGARMSEEDAIWNGADTLSTRNGNNSNSCNRSSGHDEVSHCGTSLSNQSYNYLKQQIFSSLCKMVGPKSFFFVAYPEIHNDQFCSSAHQHKILMAYGVMQLQDKQRRRSSSAPPFYRGKKKFVALNSCMTGYSEKSHNGKLHHAPTLHEASTPKHITKLSARDHLAPEVASVSDLQSKARPDQKKVIDIAETTDSETEAAHCLDVCNTNADFTLKQDQGALDIGGKWRNGCWNSSIQKPEDLTNQDSVLDLSSGILHLSGDSLLPKSISKKCLAECKALQQVDRKFIPVVGGGILAIIDQHAADERIRLEDLREKVLSGETKTITYLDAEQELVLPEIGYQLLNNYSEQIQKWGWICNFHAKSSVNLNFLYNQPSVAALIAVPCILGVNLTDADLLEFLQQLADTDGSSLIPPAVLRVLNSKACRGLVASLL